MITKLRSDWNTIFGTEWPVWLGGMLVGILNVFLFAYYAPWSTLDGILNWGGWIFGKANIVLEMTPSLTPFERLGSVINFGLIGGAFISALLAGQFGIRIGPKWELFKGLVGGLLIGVGAALVRGCNIGGFFSGVSALGAHGLMMGLGLMIGAFIGTRYLVWEMTNISYSGSDSGLKVKPKTQSILGGIFFVGLIAWAYSFASQGQFLQSGVLIFGGLLGIVSQRSRLCFVRAFREPFLTGDSSHTKAMLLALTISTAGIAIIKYGWWDRLDDFVRPTFWMGSLLGGFIFGIGMILAGGCGSGTLWRVGEGHVKLWLTLAGYITSATLFDNWLSANDMLGRLGTTLFLPDKYGWGWTLIALFVLFLVWYLAADWNQETKKFSAI